MKARNYLIQEGLAKPGRGKFSNAAKEALEAALSDGVIFEDYPATPKPQGSEKRTQRRSGKPKPKPHATMDVADPVYSVSAKFYAWVNGKKKKVNFKEVCSHSGVSLSYCTCVLSGLYPKHYAIAGSHGSQDVEVDGV